MLEQWQHKVSGDKRRLSLSETHLYYSYPTVIYGYTQCPIIGRAHYTLWIYKASEDMKCPGSSGGNCLQYSWSIVPPFFQAMIDP